jgi:hypothetical protein
MVQTSLRLDRSMVLVFLWSSPHSHSGPDQTCGLVFDLCKSLEDQTGPDPNIASQRWESVHQEEEESGEARASSCTGADQSMLCID